MNTELSEDRNGNIIWGRGKGLLTFAVSFLLNENAKRRVKQIKFCLIGKTISLIGIGLDLIGKAINLIGTRLSLMGKSINLIGTRLSLMGKAINLIGTRLSLMGKAINLIGTNLV
ncbi:hypothetical protein ACQCT6_17420 [Cytobacillus gottheilii]